MAETAIVKATVRVGDKAVTFEGPKEFVEEQVAKFTGLLPSKQQAQHYSTSELQPTGASSEREFVQAKQPEGHSEVIAVLAYYLNEHGVPEFSEDDIRRAYIRAEIRPPKVVAQAIRDAKNRYD